MCNKKLFFIISVIAIFLLFLLSFSNPASADELELAKEKINSGWWQNFYRFNHEDILSRLTSEGYFKESLSGTYSGYFPRTGGPLVKLWLNTGDYEKAKRLLNFTLEMARNSGLKRIPHIISSTFQYQLPTENSDVAVWAAMPTPLFRLDEPYSAVQAFIAPSSPLIAVEVGVGSGLTTGNLVLSIRSAPDGPVLASVTKRDDFSAVAFRRFDFSQPLALNAGQKYYIQLGWQSGGLLFWYGSTNAAPNPSAETKARDTGVGGAWLYSYPNVISAFAIDTGTLAHTSAVSPPSVLSSMDQIDGQAHIILGWALYAQKTNDQAFIETTYSQVAELIDSTFSSPYFDTGLIHNFNFEHHRDARYWNTYDLLSQSFAGQALREMIKVADARGDSSRASGWRQKLSLLESSIPDKLSWDVNGNRIYAEMLKENSNEIFRGLSWVNLAPTASAWEGVNSAMYDQTLAAYYNLASFDWHGHKVLGIEYTEGKTPLKWTVGKGLAWELLHNAQKGNWAQVNHILDFVYEAQTSNSQTRFAESFLVNSDDTMSLGDPGNGEQTVWFLFVYSELKRILGFDEISPYNFNPPAAPDGVNVN